MNIYVGNLPIELTADELRKEFDPFGQVVSVKVMNDKYIGSGQEHGYGFVEMATKPEAAIAVTFLNGLATDSEATAITDEQATALSVARSQMEWAKNTSYLYEATEYSPRPIPGGKDYINYSATITAEPLRDPDDGIQKITVTIKHSNKEIIKLESYKVER